MPLRRVSRVVVSVGALVTVFAFTTSGVGADPNANTGDRSVMVATRSWFYRGIDAATVAAKLTANRARLTDIDVNATTAPETFTVVMVGNAGAYRVSGWSWNVDRTAAQVASDLASAHGRLIDIDPYLTASGERYAEVIVPNTGAMARSWWYVIDTDSTTISNQLNANNARLEQIKSYVINGAQLYSAIMVAQTGIDAKNWFWVPLNSSPTVIQGYVDSYHDRLISLEPDPGGGFDAVLVQSEGEAWWWNTGQSAAQVTSSLATNHARAISVTPDGVGTYSVVMIDNTDAESPAVNAESRRVAAALAPGLKAGEYGVYLKAVGGASELLGFNENFRYEPASAIKVLYLLYAMRQVQLGLDSLGADFVYYPDPGNPTNPGVCPDPLWETPANAAHTTLQSALTAMMDVSDNRMTRGMALRYGVATVDAYGHSIGMANTHLTQDRIGCLFVNGVRNQLTLADAGRLYEQVDNGTLLSPANTATFYSIMLGGSVPPTSPLAAVVRAEAAKAGKAGVASQFISAMDYREKAGNEFQCVSSNCSTNPMYLDFTSVSGRMTLPFKSGGVIVLHDYVFGRFGNDFVLGCLPGSGACPADVKAQSAIGTLGSRGAETLRQQIAAALVTW
jgi:hypothetical protein